MHTEAKLIQGLKSPSTFFYRLGETEMVPRFGKRMTWLFVLSASVFGFLAFFGIGMDSLAKEATSLTPLEYELEKTMFFFGRLIAGLLYAALILFFSSLVFWTISDHGEYRKIAMVQGLTLLILLLEKLTFVPLSLFFSIEWYSSPFSLGVIAQSITSKSYVVYLLGAISLFKVWMIYLQYRGIKYLTRQKNWIIWLVIVLVNVLFWALNALLAYLDLSTLI
ncbi:hypothetical protein [Rossellomorea marisflavi]|uniref:hypothetical protein n=1 Tax=Rossellomorea marisflavi TaxID=189381 RepID=UPI00064FD0C3|nr:hypothetical protein [Rossellomorea marisflavi]KML33377.1 hypothetical protein VL12_10140 [Rossellomorea marisflavi]